jgi:hypothetical protein
VAAAGAKHRAAGKQEMSGQKPVSLSDIARGGDDPLVTLERDALMPLPAPTAEPLLTSPKASWVETFDLSLDGHSDFDFPKPKTPEDEQLLINGFLSGLQKLFDP